MLMAVQVPLGTTAVQIVIDGAETLVNVIVAVMHSERRVVRHENVDGSKLR